MNFIKKISYSIILLATYIGFTHAATPQEAVQQIRNNADTVLQILSKANDSNNPEVRHQAEEYAIPFIDFTRMSAHAVGRPWLKATPAQRQELTKEFQALIIKTYSGVMLQFKHAKVVVKNTPIIKNAKDIIVQVAITATGESRPINMDYTLTLNKDKNRYYIYDVSVEGASLITVYRNDFNQIITQSGFDGLINYLKNKNGH